MNVSELVPKPEATEAFRRDRARCIPMSAGCYVLTTISGHILYVGLTVSLPNRFEQHLDTAQKVGVTPEGRAVLFHWLVISGDLEAVERAWLNAHRVREARLPYFNKADSPVSF